MTTDNGQQTTGFFERGENKSEQRYSGKPGGFAERPKQLIIGNEQCTIDN